MCSCFCDPWEVPLNVFFIFFKGWHSQNLGPHGTGANSQLSHFFCYHLQSNFFFFCARVCPFMLLPLFWFGQMMQWVFVWFNTPLLHSWISQDSFYIIRHLELLMGKATKHHPVWRYTGREPKPYRTRWWKANGIFFQTFERKILMSDIKDLGLQCCFIFFIFFLTIRTSSATDWGSAH